MPWSPDTFLPEYVKHFEAHNPGKPDRELMKLYNVPRLYRLNNNENPLGPPPSARKIIDEYPSPVSSHYPSGDSFYLRDKLARTFSMDARQFLVGNGANEVISFVIKAFCGPGDNVITADRTFAVYEWVAAFSGIEARLVPLRDNTFDDGGMLSRIDGRTKIIFICNPNNPTGTYWSRDRLLSFMKQVGGRQIVVIDEAYFEFVEASDYPDCLSLISRFPNLVVFRTFSKMYGLAGLRIGYLAGQLPLVEAISKVCISYSVNSIGQEAARAALGDREHIARTRQLVKEGKEFLKEELGRLKLPLISGEGNFMVVRLPMSDSFAYRKLMQSGIMVRTMTCFRFPNHIRVSIGTRESLEAFITALSALPGRVSSPSGPGF